MRPADTAAASGGFTLIEILLVLFVIGLCTGLVGMAIRPDSNASVRSEALRLARLFEMAADESLLSGTHIAWSSDGSSYQFWRWRDGAWQQAGDDDALRARALPAEINISALTVENAAASGALHIEFHPYGPALAYSLELSSAKQRYVIAMPPVGAAQVIALDSAGNAVAIPN